MIHKYYQNAIIATFFSVPQKNTPPVLQQKTTFCTEKKKRFNFQHDFLSLGKMPLISKFLCLRSGVILGFKIPQKSTCESTVISESQFNCWKTWKREHLVWGRSMDLCWTRHPSWLFHRSLKNMLPSQLLPVYLIRNQAARVRDFENTRVF